MWRGIEKLLAPLPEEADAKPPTPPSRKEESGEATTNA
jgi:hypothetical protein